MNAGAFFSLLVKLLYDDINGKRNSKLNWVEPDYC